jgi:hypothetical protein
VIQIEVTLPGLTAYSQAMATAMDSALDVLGEYARERIEAHARNKLHTSWLDYSHGLQDTRSVIRQPGSFAITLVGKVPNMMEKGTGPFDMKPGLLGSKNAKQGKNGGTYIDVPFRHGLPGSTTLPPMSRGAATNMAAAVRQVRKVVGNINSTSIQTRGRTQGTGTRKVGIYDQMTRIPKDTGKAIGAQYRTFRRVSSNSSKQAWMHPGFQGIHAFEGAMKDVMRDMPKILADIMKQAVS